MVTEAIINELIDDWLTHRDAAAALLVEQFSLNSPRDVLRAEHRGRRELPGTGWAYRTHGVGVDVTRINGHGGIDFDFALDGSKMFADPDWYRLHLFAKRSAHEKSIETQKYADIIDNIDKHRSMLESVIARRFTA